jgi:type I restriction enzyme, S subunit
MSEWKQVRLGDFATSFAGGTPSRDNDAFFGGSIPWIKSTEVNRDYVDYTEEHLTKLGLQCSAAKPITSGAVLMALYGATAGEVAMLRIDATANQAVLAITPVDTETSSQFLYYALVNEKPQILYKAQGSGQPNLSKSLIDSLRLTLPPLPQQRKIARILTTVDNLIEQTEALIEKYKSIKQGMMHDLFTRGVDQSGQLRPSYEDAPELYKESELGWIPKEWFDCQWKEFVKKWGYGPRFSAANYSDIGNVKTIRGTDFTGDGRIKCRQVPMAMLPHAMVTRHQLEQNDLVVVTTADCGVSAVFEVQECPFIASAYAVAFRFNEDVDPYYVDYFMRTDSSKRQVNKYVRQGTIGNLPGSDLLTFWMPRPCLAEQQECVRRLDSLSETTRHQYDYLQKLRLTKSGLMQDLLTGKVRVNVDETEEVTQPCPSAAEGVGV